MAHYDEEPTGNGNFGNESTEKSIKSCYAVVYELENRKWVVSGEGGWSEVHLCEDSLDNSHRILAWTVKSQQVLMNCNVTAECAYKEKSKNFHSFSDENGNRYGLGFHKSESGLKQATQFLKSVKSVISACTAAMNAVPPPSMPPAPPVASSHHSAHKYQSGHGHGHQQAQYGQSVQPGPPPNPYQQQQPVAKSGSMSQSKSPTAPSMYKNDSNSHSATHYSSPKSNHQYDSQSRKGSQYQYHQPPQQKQPPPQPQQQKQSHYKRPPHGNSMQVNSVSPRDSSPSPQHSASLGNAAHAKLNGADTHSFQPTVPHYHLSKQSQLSVPTVPLGPLGNLKILPPKQQKHFSGDKKIKNPTAVEHKMRVLHDKETGLYTGLPQEWLEHLNKQFGVNPKDLKGVKLEEYEAKIPNVLVALRSKLEEANAYQQVGIFRLAPNASDNKAVKEKIDKGVLDVAEEQKVDVNVYANLIKVWFRDLPDPLLNCVNPDLIEHVASADEAGKVVQQMPEPSKSIFLWLCDMCVDVAQYEQKNKMGAGNMAIVVGPNLFNLDKIENPMKAMTFSGKVVEFFKHAIIWRQKMWE